ncbi:MAG: transcription termination/antitermination NusG family protein [Kiritimatiellia bacterium]|jgi:transcriptional antiterminator RfaH
MDESSLLPAPDQDHAWCVLHARPRCEKKVVEFCKTRSIYAYLPLMVKKHRYGARLRQYEVPLFTGYVFALAGKQDVLTLRQNQRVANLLSVYDQDTLLRQLQQVKTALDNQESMELFPHLVAGMKVEVRSGPLKGVEGFIHKLKSKTRIVLNIDFIQQAVAVEVEADLLVPV